MKLDQVIKISLISFGAFPIIPFKIKGLPVALLLICAIVVFTRNKIKKGDLKQFFIFSSLFFINIASLLNTFSFPGKKIEIILSLLLVPLSFLTVNSYVSSKVKKNFAYTFAISSAILAASHLLYYFNLGLFSEDSLKVNSFRKAVTQIPILNDHPIYVSIFLAIAVILSINYFKKAGKKQKLIYFLVMMLCVIDLILLSSKGVLIGMVISICLYFFLAIKSIKTKGLLVAGFLGLFILSIFYVPTLERRFRELKIQSTYNKIQPNNSSSVRIGIYKCVFKTINKKPITGYGLGTYPQKECYQELSDHLYKLNYNSHNQFLGYMLIAGVFGLFVLLFFLFYNIKSAMVFKDHLYFTLIIFFSIIMLTENILERQSGLILFIFVSCLLFYQNRNHKKNAKDIE
ncbi:O-antigen ligase family protein [Pseudotenacibaculum sp. MALMAid0570]|uniref:O-antigen ligase family protein n=1 Tax=Pseudotenacibaculum sp. MALMAid0570 TaxID=3143938 RepID=UPI0032DE56A0